MRILQNIILLISIHSALGAAGRGSGRDNEDDLLHLQGDERQTRDISADLVDYRGCAFRKRQLDQSRQTTYTGHSPESYRARIGRRAHTPRPDRHVPQNLKNHYQLSRKLPTNPYGYVSAISATSWNTLPQRNNDYELNHYEPTKPQKQTTRRGQGRRSALLSTYRRTKISRKSEK